jgi:YidC/Oxa1 family membrane protein insertase
MSPWTMWLDALRGLMDALSSQAGLGLGLGIVAGTILLRVALLPISWSVAYRSCIRQKRMMNLQPELQQLGDRYGDKPDVYMQEMMSVYRRRNLTFFDGKSLLGVLAQMPLFLGMFQVLRGMGDGVRFLWVPNLLRPDTLLALLAGATTALMILVNPDMPEQMRLFMILVPSVIAIMAALNFCSALAVYWVASNTFSAVQTTVLHYVVDRRVRAGALKI